MQTYQPTWSHKSIIYVLYIHKIYVTTLLPHRRVKYIHFIRSQIHFSNKVVCVFYYYTYMYAAIKKRCGRWCDGVFCMPATERRPRTARAHFISPQQNVCSRTCAARLQTEQRLGGAHTQWTLRLHARFKLRPRWTGFKTIVLWWPIKMPQCRFCLYYAHMYEPSTLCACVKLCASGRLINKFIYRGASTAYARAFTICNVQNSNY